MATVESIRVQEDVLTAARQNIEGSVSTFINDAMKKVVSGEINIDRLARKGKSKTTSFATDPELLSSFKNMVEAKGISFNKAINMIIEMAANKTLNTQ